MKRILFVIFLACPIHLFAQQKITGLITDTQGLPLDAATVSLAQNDKVISSQFADHGKFTLLVANKLPYQLSVTLLGYQSQSIKIQLPAAAIKVILLPDSKQLNEVVIAYKKPTIERKADRIVFNVENSVIAAGGSVLEAIGKAPGVQVSSSGGISASNKAVTIYIDDKPIRLSGDDLNTYLQSLPADQITKIEVMSNPSSKYEAQGGAVINIVSKKIKGEGFNANINGGYTQAHLGSYKAGTIFNYSKGKLSVFGTYGYSSRNIQRDVNNYIIYQNPAAYSFWDINKTLLPKTQTHTYSLGVDYNISANQVFGLLVTGNNSANTNNSNSLTSVYNNHNLLPDSLLHTNNNNSGNTNQYSINLNYKIKLGEQGRSLNADVDYVPYSTSSRQTVDNRAILPNGDLSSAPYHSISPATQDISIWSGKIDYDFKLGKKLTVESGLKYTSITTSNKFDFFEVENSTQIFDPGKSDFFRYTENTGAAYGIISGDIGKLTLKFGLRAEQTNTQGYSFSTDSLNKNNYLRIFPTAFMSYKFSDENMLGVNFARRIDRPGYSQLNPAKIYVSPYAYSSGNPFLRPAVSNNLEVNYTFKENYTLTGNFYQVSDLTNPITIQNNDNQTFYSTQENTGNIRDIGLQFSGVNHPAIWWETSYYLEGYTRRQDLRYLTGEFENSFHFYIKSDNAFTLLKDKGLKAELSAWYTGPLQQGTYHLGRTWDLSTGLSKSLWNNRGTLRLAANDMFFTNPIHININYLDQHTGFVYKNDSRNMNLSFTYKIGKKVNEARKRATATEEEKQRNR
jgi:outer membrane receptor protein involved in Fe transport